MSLTGCNQALKDAVSGAGINITSLTAQQRQPCDTDVGSKHNHPKVTAVILSEKLGKCADKHDDLLDDRLTLEKKLSINRRVKTP